MEVQISSQHKKNIVVELLINLEIIDLLQAQKLLYDPVIHHTTLMYKELVDLIDISVLYDTIKRKVLCFSWCHSVSQKIESECLIEEIRKMNM